MSRNTDRVTLDSLERVLQDFGVGITPRLCALKELPRPLVLVNSDGAGDVFEVAVPSTGHDFPQVRFITDSVEVLRGLSSRGFPLEELARYLTTTRSGTPLAESVIDVFLCNNADKIIAAEGKLRIITRVEPHTYEVRLIK